MGGPSVSLRRHTRLRLRPWKVLLSGVVVSGLFAAGYLQTSQARAAFGDRPRHLDTYRDGTYSAWARGYHGRIYATVFIRRGRIESVSIAVCRMRYPCSMIAGLPAQVESRQSADVDIVSGATDSTQVFAAAVDNALALAARSGPR